MSQSMSNCKQAHSSLYSFFGGKQSSDGKEINTASEHLLQPRNKQVPGGMGWNKSFPNRQPESTYTLLGQQSTYCETLVLAAMYR